MDYLLRDVYHSLRGNTVKFSLKTEYMPIVGFFFKVSKIPIKAHNVRDRIHDAIDLHKPELKMIIYKPKLFKRFFL